VKYTIAAFYRFFSLSEPEALRAKLFARFEDSDLRGTLLIATEGINGTMAGSASTIDLLLEELAESVGLDRTEVKFSRADEPPFQRLKLRVKSEIIAFRETEVDPAKPGTYVGAREWNDLLADPEVLLLDTRNLYETEIGTFEGATLPAIEKFSDFVTYVREELGEQKDRKIAMFCTGGIRCEKASAFMLQEGFDTVYHLKGGILKYLEEVAESESKWQGKCYVFDDRESVDHTMFTGS
jgi:UPF0176 protein